MSVIIAAAITSLTTVACVFYTNRRQLGNQTREFEQITERQTRQFKAHVDGTGRS